jgi:hypothetical protein
MWRSNLLPFFARKNAFVLLAFWLPGDANRPALTVSNPVSGGTPPTSGTLPICAPKFPVERARSATVIPDDSATASGRVLCRFLILGAVVHARAGASLKPYPLLNHGKLRISQQPSRTL